MLKRFVQGAALTAVVGTAGVFGLGQAAGANESSTYVVKPGDTLSGIAPSNWRDVAAFNDIENPDLIFPGQVLQLDVPASTEAAPVQSEEWTDDSEDDWAEESADADASEDASAPAPDPEPAASTGSGVWDSLAECESGGDWSISTGNGYYGGLQFSQGSWEAAGGSGNPANASREEQIRVAENLLEQQGWGAWPTCSSKLGLR